MRHESGLEPVQQSKCGIGVPALVPELEDMAQVGGQQRQEGLEPVEVDAQHRWQLIQDRAERVPQMPRWRKHAGQRLLAILQLLCLSDEAVGLHRVNETWR